MTFESLVECRATIIGEKLHFNLWLALLSSTMYSVPCFVVAAGPWWPSSKIQSTVLCILPTVQ